MVFIHVVRGRPSGPLQFPAGVAVKICFASVSSGKGNFYLQRSADEHLCFIPLLRRGEKLAASYDRTDPVV